ncbi:MAG: hypothetical protein AB7I48_04300 [Planctomycetaceae bacterium]
MRLLAVCPRIRKDSGRIVATTAWRVRVLLLGMVYRQVVIDPTARAVTMFSRFLWFIRRTRSMNFSRVRAVTYGYEDLSSDQILAYAWDSFDWFTVGLRLADDSELHLFSFIGEGTFGNDGPFPDWMYWEDFRFDISGSQERESRAFVDVLSLLLDVPVIPSRR